MVVSGERCLDEARSCLARGWTTAFTAGVVFAVGTFLVGPSSAGAGTRECRQACTRVHRACVAAAAAERTTRRAACPASGSARKACRQDAKRTFREFANLCRTIRQECRTCCRATGGACEALHVVPDTTRTGSAVVGEAGGTVRATAADGTLYTLEVPPGALTAAETITVTPVAVVGHLPLSGGLVAAAELGPDGLDLLRRATLVVDLPRDVPADGLIGFGAQDDGGGFHLRIAAHAARSVTLGVTHFSMAGAGIATTADIQAILSQPPTNPELHFGSQLAALFAQNEQDPLLFQFVLRDWYTASGLLSENLGVRALLGTLARANDTHLMRALRQYVAWREAAAQVSARFGGAPFVAAEEAEAADLAVIAILTAVARNDQSCLSEQMLRFADTALFWQAVAEALGLVNDDNFQLLGREAVIENLCVGVTVQATLSEPIQTGVPSTLVVDPVLSPAFFLQAARVGIAIDAAGVADPVGSSHVERGEDVFETTVRPSGIEPLVLRIEACIDDPEFPRLHVVCAVTEVAGPSPTTTSTSSSTSTTVPGVLIPSGCYNYASGLSFGVCGEPEGSAGCLGVQWSATVTVAGPGAIQVALRRQANTVEGVGTTSAFNAIVTAVAPDGSNFTGAGPDVPSLGIAPRQILLPSPAPGVAVSATLDPPIDDICFVMQDGEFVGVPISASCISFVAVHSAFLNSGLCGE